VGKTGGTTVHDVLNEKKLKFDEVHTVPVYGNLNKYDLVVYTARDPVARMVSAFYWSAPPHEGALYRREHCFQDIEKFASSMQDPPDQLGEGSHCPTAREMMGHPDADGTFIRYNYAHTAAMHTFWGPCFYVGGLIKEMAHHPRLFVVQTETLDDDVQKLLYYATKAKYNWNKVLEAFQKNQTNEITVPDKMPSGADHDDLSDSARRQLELGLQDDYGLQNYLMDHSVNKRGESYQPGQPFDEDSGDVGK
jgi:hypothetical protein